MLDTKMLKQECLATLQLAFKENPRGAKKQQILHGWLARVIGKEIGSNYEVFSLRDQNTEPNISKELRKETTIDGKYYPKKVDIAVKREGSSLGVISVKFIMSSYKKNAINYFEHQLGETANLKGKGLIYGSLIFITNPIPLRDKNGKIVGTELFNDKAILRYSQLSSDLDSSVDPTFQSIVIASLSQNQLEISHLPEPNELGHLSELSINFLRKANLRDFIIDFCDDVKRKYERDTR